MAPNLNSKEIKDLVNKIIPKLSSKNSEEFLEKAAKEIKEFPNTYSGSKNITTDNLNEPMTL